MHEVRVIQRLQQPTPARRLVAHRCDRGRGMRHTHTHVHVPRARMYSKKKRALTHQAVHAINAVNREHLLQAIAESIEAVRR